MKWNQLDHAIRALVILTTEPNKVVFERSKLNHIEGQIYGVTLDHSDASRFRVLDIQEQNLRLVCRNGLERRTE